MTVPQSNGSGQNQNNQNDEALIMVVDDNLEFLNGIELTLSMEGFKIWTVLNGQQALDELKCAFLGQDEGLAGPESLPDLILADIMMPVMDGYVFYEQVRINPYLDHIPFIFLTSKDSEDDIRYGKVLGSDDYLSKLSPTEDMLASIHGKLNRIKQHRLLTTAPHTDEDKTKPFQMNPVILTVILVLVIGMISLAAFLFIGST